MKLENPVHFFKFDLNFQNFVPKLNQCKDTWMYICLIQFQDKIPKIEVKLEKTNMSYFCWHEQIYNILTAVFANISDYMYRISLRPWASLNVYIWVLNMRSQKMAIVKMFRKERFPSIIHYFLHCHLNVSLWEF